MDGVLPRPRVPLNGGGGVAVLLGPVLWSVPRLARCAVVTAAVMSCYCLVVVSCGVVWGECVSEVFVWWGILRLLPPPVVVEGVAVVGWWGTLWWWVAW